MKKIWQKSSASQLGMTMLEIVLALGLSALVTLAVVEFYSSYTKKLKDMGDTIESSTDIESGQQILLKDLKSLEPSFSALNLLDDTGKSFFEYYPDVPERDLDQDPICQRPCRTYTMKAEGKFAEIVLILQDPRASEIQSLIYDPTWSFDITSNPNPMSGNGAVPTFNLAKTRAAIELARPKVTHIEGGRTIVDWSGYWQNGQLLMFDSPSLFRPDGTTDWAHNPPRPPFFIGMVRDNSFNGLSTMMNALDVHSLTGAVVQTNLLITKHPTNPSNSISDVATFFLTLPPNGGGQPMVRLRPVRLIKYVIKLQYPGPTPTDMPKDELAKRKNALRIFRKAYVNGSWGSGDGQLIAENVKTLQFRRSTVTDKAVSFELSKQELKKGGE